MRLRRRRFGKILFQLIFENINQILPDTKQQHLDYFASPKDQSALLLLMYAYFFRSSKQEDPYPEWVPESIKNRFDVYHLQKHVLADDKFIDWQEKMEAIRDAQPAERGQLQTAFDEEVQEYIVQVRE